MSDTLPPIAPATAPNVQPPTVTNLPGSDLQIVGAADGGSTREQLGAEPPDSATNAAQQREAAIAESFAPSADGYSFRYDPNFAQASDIAELAAVDAEIKAAFAHAQVPTVLAQPLLDAILETGELYQSESMTDAGRELRWREEGSLFKKISRDWQEDARLAAIGYAALPKNFRDQLDATYALHSARAQVQLAALGRALEYRQTRKKN